MMDVISQTDQLLRSVISEHIDQRSTKQVEQALIQIKTFGRQAEVSKCIKLETLYRLMELYVVQKKSPHTSHLCMIESLTILANALVWNEELLQQFDPTFIITRVLNECFQPDVEEKDVYLFMRLLFLFTFHGRKYEEKLLKTGLAAVASKIAKTASNEAVFATPIERLSFIECMKFTFNMLHHYPLAVEYIQGYTASSMVKIFYTLDPRYEYDLCMHISNCLLCLPVSTWLYENDSKLVLERLLSFIEIMLNPENENLRQDRILSPPLSLLHCIVTDIFGPAHSNLELQQTSRDWILPSEKDREKVLGSSESLSGYMLNITIDPVMRTTRNIIFDIFYRVSHESPDEFVGNFGLGFASSFLASQGIAFPGSLSTTGEASGSSGNSHANSNNKDINPITGQYMSFEKKQPNPVDEMTEEEKERDAERMFVLFERLKANNMIQVENPVEVAARQGKLQQLD